MELDCETEVFNGIAWLDQVAPGWDKKIDLVTFRLWSTFDCILGQLFGSEMYDAILDMPDGLPWIRSHGFSNFGEDYWREEILSRRLKG